MSVGWDLLHSGPESRFNDFTILHLAAADSVCRVGSLMLIYIKKRRGEASLFDIPIAKPAIKLLLCPNHALLGF